MRNWWRRSSLKLRLALSFTLVASAIMLGLTPVIYGLIERRLLVEMDRQLRVDWDLIDAHLESGAAGAIQWKKASPATPSSPGYSESWFDVWSGEELLLSYWPANGVKVGRPPAPLKDSRSAFLNLEVEQGLPARTFDQRTRIGGREVILRVLRDKTGLRRTLREILIGLALGVPLTALLAAVGGHLMAGRMLMPIGAMAEQARRITSESLGRRLPIPNPHDELGQLAAVFNETLQRLENSFESLKRFTADASHELRTPLTALRTVGEVALREADDARVLGDTVGSMLEEAQRLNDLIDSLLLLARAEGKRTELHREEVAVDELIAGVCDSVGVLAVEKEQTIEINSDPAVVVHADRLLLRHAVMSLLHNAIRYSPAGTTVRLRSFLRADEAVIEIADEGPGIAAEHHAKIFERFYRIDKARSRSEGGTGLGLAIAKLSVGQLGGNIDIASEIGRGSRFQIVLPARRPGSSPQNPGTAES